MECIHTIEYYVAIQRNQLPKYAGYELISNKLFKVTKRNELQRNKTTETPYYILTRHSGDGTSTGTKEFRGCVDMLSKNRH